MKIPKFSNLLKYHILLGISLNFIPQIFILHLYIFLCAYITLLFTSFGNLQKFKHYFLLGFIYFPLSEAVGRLHSLDPFVPWELGKYVAIFFVMVLVFSGNIVIKWRFLIGILLIFTTIINGDTTWKLVFFNGIIAFCIMLMGDYFQSIKLTFTKLLIYLRYSILPLLVFLNSTLTQLQNFKAEETRLDSSKVLDGIPSNQVATYMGLGFLLMIVFFKWKIDFGIKPWQRLILSFGMLVVGVISFSRGGIIVGLIGVILLYFSSFNDLLRFKYFKQILILLPVLLLIALFINKQTNGNLFLRYQGETEGTLAGSKEKGINTLTTNRFNIMLGDLEIFKKNFLLGVSTGKSKEYRIGLEGELTHLEFSRLLAEHGIVGLFVFIIWIKDLFILRRGYMSHLKFVLYLVGLATTFHGAMRTSVPMVLMLISIIQIVPDKSISRYKIS